jgi:hypothetical protein
MSKSKLVALPAEMKCLWEYSLYGKDTQSLPPPPHKKCWIEIKSFATENYLQEKSTGVELESY